MELIPLLRTQLDRLCGDVSVDPNWMLGRLSEALRERYGSLAVGFARWRKTEDDCLQLLGLCDCKGRILLPVAKDFRPDGRHPQTTLQETTEEAWMSVEQFGGWGNRRVDQCFKEARGAFLAPWLIDKPTDWLILVLSPIAAPVAHREDRGLTVAANLLATNLLRALDAKRLEQANAWIDRELAEISRLQRLLQPERRIKLRGIDLAFSSYIYRYAGGDYFDLPCLTPFVDEDQRHPFADHFGVLIADVSGHGPSAAVEAAMMDAIMRTYVGSFDDGPEMVAAYLNRYMFTRRPRAAFVSAFLCNYDPVQRVLRHVNCGHPPPLIASADGSVSDLEVASDIPLRIERDYQWTGIDYEVQDGDVLVMYTDGVTETRDPDGRELGRDGLAALVRHDMSAVKTLAHIRRGLRAFAGDRPPQDDQTIIVLRWR